MGVRFSTSRFHVVYGPSSLFERVVYKMSGSRTLKLHGDHFNNRYIERNISPNLLEMPLRFDPVEWRSVTVKSEMILESLLIQLGKR